MLKYLEIDLSNLQKHTGKLIPGVDVEMRLVELFKLFYFNDEPLESFTQYLLGHVYADQELNVIHTYDEVLDFYKEKFYLSVVFEFISLVEHLVLNKINDIDIINISFKNWVDKTNYIAKFEYEVVDEILKH